MRAALDAAAAAASMGEVPVGAVVVLDGRVIATAANAPRTRHDPTAHAEMLAIRAAAEAIGDDRLSDCDLWVTLEPCAGCAGAIAHARSARLSSGAPDPKGRPGERPPRGAEAGAGRVGRRRARPRPDCTALLWRAGPQGRRGRTWSTAVRAADGASPARNLSWDWRGGGRAPIARFLRGPAR